MKLFKSWKFIFFVSIIMVYSIFGFTMFSEEIKLPSEGFSRHVELANFDVETFQESRNASTISSVKLENGNVGLIYYEDSLHYVEVASDSIILDNSSFDLSFTNLKQISMISKVDNSLEFYVLQGSNIYKYTLDLVTSEITQNLINENAISFSASKNFINIIHKDGFSIINTANSNFTPIYESKSAPRRLSNLIDNGSLFFSYIATDQNGVQKLWYYEYNEKLKESLNLEVSKIPENGNYSTSSLSLLKENEKVSILHEGTDYKTGTSTLTLYEASSKINNTIDFTPNPLRGLSNADSSILISNNNNSFEFISRVPNLGSNSEIAYDIYKFKYDNYELTESNRLTKSRGNSANPIYIPSNDDYYLLWTDSVGLSKKLLLASSSEKFISSSNHMTKDDKFETFMTVIFTLFPTLFAIMIPVLSIGGPIVFILMVLSFVNLTFVESSGKKLLPIILLLHVILKLRFIYSAVFSSVSELGGYIPPFITNPFTLFPLLIALTFVSLWINYLRNNKFFNGQDIWTTYIIFMIIDILLMWLAVMPYIYGSL